MSETPSENLSTFKGITFSWDTGKWILSIFGSLYVIGAGSIYVNREINSIQEEKITRLEEELIQLKS